MYQKRNIYLLYAIALLQGMIFYGPIATLYRKAAGLTVLQITIIESISLAHCLVLEIPWGILADKIGYRITMAGCCVLYFVSKIIFWQASGFGDFLMERILLSVVISGISGVDTSMLYLSAGEQNSQKIFGLYFNLNTAGLLFASLIYALFIKNDYRLAGLLTVFSYALAAMLALGLKEVHDASRRPAAREFVTLLRQIGKNKRFILFLIGVALLNETHQTITVFLGQLQFVRGGLTPATMGYIYIGVTIAGLFGGYSAWFTKQLGTLTFSVLIYFLSAASCVIMALTGNAVLSVGAILILRMTFSLYQPLQLEIQNRAVTSRNRATALSVNALLINSVGVATNLAFGKLADQHLPWAMLLGSSFCLVGLAHFILFYSKQR